MASLWGAATPKGLHLGPVSDADDEGIPADPFSFSVPPELFIGLNFISNLLGFGGSGGGTSFFTVRTLIE